VVVYLNSNRRTMGDIGTIEVETKIKITYTTNIHFPDIDLNITLNLVQDDFQLDSEFMVSGKNPHLRIPVGKNVIIKITAVDSVVIQENGEIYVCRENSAFDKSCEIGEKLQQYALKSLYVDKLKRNSVVCEKIIIERIENESGEFEFVKFNIDDTTLNPLMTVTNIDGTGRLNKYTDTFCENAKNGSTTPEEMYDELLQGTTDSLLSNENGEKEHNRKLNIMSVKRNVKCFLCNEFQCTTDEELQLHRLSEHASEKPSSKYKCIACGNVYSSRVRYRLHLRSHLHKKPFKCKQCNEGFSSYKELCTHKNQHTDNRPFVCSTCGSAFRTAYILKVHIKRHKGEKPYNCEECDSKFLFRYQLENHKIRYHNSQRGLHLCDICGSDFLLKVQLKYHVEKHHGEYEGKKERKCRICNIELTSCSHWTASLERRRKKLKRGYFLENALELHYDDGGKSSFMCLLCDVTYSSAFQMTEHNKVVHVLNAKHLCKYCELTFQKRTELVDHVRTAHNNERHFQCEQCPKRFFNLTHLNTHTAGHQNQKTFTCNICGKSFNLKGNLKVHELLHSGKVYQCMTCEDKIIVEADIGMGGRELKDAQCGRCGNFGLKLIRNVTENAKLLKTETK